MSESCCCTQGAEDSCAVPQTASETRACPVCGSDGPVVDWETVAALTRVHVAPRQVFRLCREPDCPAVYHGELGVRFDVADLHAVPGFKTPGPEGLVCYCFMHSRGEIRREMLASGKTTVPQRISAQIKAGNCACEVRNPAGRCCLGEVNRAVSEIRDQLARVLR